MTQEVDQALEFIDELHQIISNRSCLPKYVVLSKQERIEEFLGMHALPDNFKVTLRRYRDVISELYNTSKRG